MLVCKYCNQELDGKSAKLCPHCGAVQAPPRLLTRVRFLDFLLGFLCVPVRHVRIVWLLAPYYKMQDSTTWVGEAAAAFNNNAVTFVPRFLLAALLGLPLYSLLLKRYPIVSQGIAYGLIATIIMMLGALVICLPNLY